MRIHFGTVDARAARRLAVAVAGAVIAIAPAVAGASTVSQDGYVAAVGETNNLTVTDNGTTLTFVDPGAAITATEGCLPAGVSPAGTPVVCPQYYRLEIFLDDGNDQTTFAGPFDLLQIGQFGGSGDDTLRGPATAPNSFFGEPGNFLFGEAGADTLVGGPGKVDIAYYARVTNSVDVSLDDVANDGAVGEADNVMSTVERVVTGSGDDTIVGNAADNVLIAGAGNDSIEGGAGNDALEGDTGSDTLSGGDGDDDLYPGNTVAGIPDGADTLTGGAGIDYAVVYAEGPAPRYAPLDVSIRLNDQADDGIGGEGDNYRSDIEDVSSVRGGHDTLTGTDAINILSTSSGNDSLSGGAGNDILRSAAGDDTIDARDGYADRVDCGPGADTALVDTLDQVSPSCETVQPADVGNANDIPEDAPPTVAFTAPAENASIPGSGASVTVDAADDHGIARVVLIDDGRVVATDTVAPYVFSYRPLGSDRGANTLIAQAVDGREQASTAVRRVRVGRFEPVSVTATVLPARDRARPFRFRVTGAVRRPPGVTAAQGCAAGTVTVTVKRGVRTIASRQAKLQRSCTYAVVVRVSLRGRYAVKARFGGNTVLQARSSASRSVRAG